MRNHQLIQLSFWRLVDLLSSQQAVRCLNLPADTTLVGWDVDLRTGIVQLAIASETFPVVPKRERLPFFDLSFEVLRQEEIMEKPNGQ